jgi:hypothetical protein
MNYLLILQIHNSVLIIIIIIIIIIIELLAKLFDSSMQYNCNIWQSELQFAVQSENTSLVFFFFPLNKTKLVQVFISSINCRLGFCIG